MMADLRDSSQTKMARQTMCTPASKDVPAKVQQEDLRELTISNKAKEWLPGDPVRVIKDLRQNISDEKNNTGV
jgi:hypothetical protein